MKQLVIAGSSRLILLSLFPLIAVAADDAMRHVDPQTLPWYTWGFVVGLSLIGWLASSAPLLAGWHDEDGEKTRDVLTRRLTIVKGFACALTAGIVAYLLGLYAGTPNVLNFVAVLFASFGGDAYLRRKADQQAAAKGA